jgi:hypothetical protein
MSAIKEAGIEVEFHSGPERLACLRLLSVVSPTVRELRDLIFSIEVNSGRFSGRNVLWCRRPNFDEFLTELAALDSTRRGQARLMVGEAGGGGTFNLSLWSTNEPNVIAVKGELNGEQAGRWQTLTNTVTFDADLNVARLSAFVETFHRMAEVQ